MTAEAFADYATFEVFPGLAFTVLSDKDKTRRSLYIQLGWGFWHVAMIFGH